MMQSVLNLAGTKISDFPSAGLLSQMLVELRQISHLQVASSVADTEYTTIFCSHSDGTSKHGISYQLSYQIATADDVFSIGMVEMKSSTAQHVFETLKQVLGDIDQVACQGGYTNVAKPLVRNMKSTMSNRCAVPKVTVIWWSNIGQMYFLMLWKGGVSLVRRKGHRYVAWIPLLQHVISVFSFGIYKLVHLDAFFGPYQYLSVWHIIRLAAGFLYGATCQCVLFRYFLQSIPE